MDTIQFSNSNNLQTKEMISPAYIPAHSAPLANIRISARDVADRIRTRERSQTDAMIENGRDLMEMKKLLGDELFKIWLQVQCQFSEKTAEKYMQFASSLDDDFDIIRDMPMEVLNEITAPRSTCRMWEIVFKYAKQGKRLSLSELNQLVMEKRQAYKAAQAEKKANQQSR